MASLIFSCVGRSADVDEKPNIVLMFLDNIGYGDLGCYGNREMKTPRIDRFATQGVRCTDFYIASPSCMPSRGAILTGRHPVRNGLNKQLTGNSHEQIGLPHREALLPQYLAKAGYVSGCFGKWNIGFAPGSRPTDRGFDEYYGNISGNCDYYTYIYVGRNDLYRNTEPAKAEGYSTYVFADAACDFIERNKDKPFFCYIPFNAAHFPNPKNKPPGTPCLWQAPDEAFARYGYSPDTLDERKRYQAVVTALDDGVGRVLDQIDRLNLTKKTIVIVLSDNGAFMLPARGMECASNAPLRAGGVTLWEGGIRVPCIVRWPGRIRPGTLCREPLTSMDFMPMALRAAGLSLPSDRVLDGKDPTETLAGKAPSPHKYLYWRWGSKSAGIRMGRYKLLREQQSTNQDWQLFDLQTDIGETANLVSAKPELVEHLKIEYERWEKEAKSL
ncbi:MAG: sulfatase-like hydrolase/transferase [Sedimentisphaerales bacterium]|nr:sulfatase-like hydrolase/transferase [Sedimentisphaerales bacterium]